MCLTSALFWPALWSPDTISQMEQARSNRFTDHHPAIMALLLRPLALIGIEKGIIFIQVIVFWGTVWVLYTAVPEASRVRRIRAAYPILLPTSIALIGIIWKDVHLALAWGLAWSLMWRLHRRGASGWLKIAPIAALLLYALLVRHNAFVAAAPLVLYLAKGRPWLKTPSLTIAAYLIITLAAFSTAQLANRHLLPVEHVATAELSLPIFDLAGISTYENRNAFPFAMSKQQLEQVQTCYRPVRWDSLYYQNSPCGWLMTAMVDYEAKGGSVTTTWLRTIAAHPLAYLRHRAAFLACFLTYAHEPGADTHRATYGFSWFEDPVPGRGALIGGYLAALSLWETLGLMSPLVALTWSAALLWYGRGQATYPAIATAVFTAVLNIVSHVPFGVASDQRYSYPSFILLALATSLLLLTLRTDGDRRAAQEP